MSDWYAIVDGAADPRLYGEISASKNYACLYSGDYDDKTRMVLPYLVHMQKDARISKIWQKHESGRYWGMLCQSGLGLKELRRHFRHFTTTIMPDGEVVLFRFWDPRVFAPFSEKAASDELGPFFKNIDTVIIDLGAEGRRRYRWRNGLQTDQRMPQQEKKMVSDIYG